MLAPQHGPLEVDKELFLDGRLAGIFHNVKRLFISLILLFSWLNSKSPSSRPRRNYTRVQFHSGSECLEPRMMMTAPRGVSDGIEGMTAIGWAFDPDALPQSVQLQFLIDNRLIATQSTGVARPDVNRAFGIDGDHGFRFAIPASYFDGRSHEIRVRAIDTTDGRLVTLTNSPKRFANRLPVANFDGIRNDLSVIAWAFDPDASKTSTSVIIRIDKRVVATVPANKVRPDVNSVFRISGNHGIDWSIPAEFRDLRNHVLHIDALGVSGETTQLISGYVFNSRWDYPERGGDTHIPDLLRPANYDYAPTIIENNGIYQMFWTSGVRGVIEGDHILMAESRSPNGPWTFRGTVFGPSTSPTAFDGAHTADPSVVKVGNSLYMYYSGLPLPKMTSDGPVHTDGGPFHITKIGVAKSVDGGRHWVRLNSRNPIISPMLQRTGNDYGAGQPSVFYRDGRFHLIHTDTTSALGAVHQYALRSSDPTFQTNVDELRSTGWVRLRPGEAPSRSHPAVSNALGVDWVYVASVNRIAVLHGAFRDNIGGHISERFALRFLDPITFRETSRLELVARWAEGPGIVRRADGSAIEAGGFFKVDVFRALGPTSTPDNPSTWDLAFVGFDILANSIR